MPDDHVSEYLEFRTKPQDPARVTAVVEVVSKSKDIILAEIRWYGPWRQYCFYPGVGTLWNKDCLRHVNAHIAMLMEERRRQRAVQPQPLGAGDD